MSDIEFTQATAYDDGYECGYEMGIKDILEEGAEIPDWVEIFLDELSRKALDPLEGLHLRWDAALKALVCTQKGREVMFKKEGER